jgi:hypothetical protein
MEKFYKLLSIGAFSLVANTVDAQCTIPSLVTASPSAICVGATTTLNATSVGSSIHWFTVPVAGVAVGTSVSGANINFTPATTTTYYAEAFVVGASATLVYNYTGAVQTFTVPLGITQMTIDAKGAQGGGTYGGNGGRTQAVITVTPGEVLNLYVGSQPTVQLGPGGYNGGGAVTALPCGGGSDGFPGGGASDIRRAGIALVNRIIVAGGGGGQGYSNGLGGLGGGLIGGDGFTSWIAGTNGKGGTQSAGGAGGIYSSGPASAPSGSLGVGGNSAPTSTYCTGGGGGGGYYGGGGGFVSAPGGGSNYVLAGATSTVFTQGTQTGNGQISISYFVGSCTSVSRTAITVTVDPIPTVVVNSGAICDGKSFTITPSGASTYTISGGSAIVTPTASSNYTVTGSSAFAGCLSPIAISSVTVNANPSVVASTSNSIICVGSNAVLTASTSATSYTWNTGATTMTTTVSPTVTTTYTVNITNAATCVASSTVMITVNTCTGVKEDLSNLISVYPNPNNGVLSISLTAELSLNSSLEVYDSMGKLVVKQLLENELNSINISNLDNGMYTFKVLNNSSTIKIGKLIKQ